MKKLRIIKLLRGRVYCSNTAHGETRPITAEMIQGAIVVDDAPMGWSAEERYSGITLNTPIIQDDRLFTELELMQMESRTHRERNPIIITHLGV